MPMSQERGLSPSVQKESPLASTRASSGSPAQGRAVGKAGPCQHGHFFWLPGLPAAEHPPRRLATPHPRSPALPPGTPAGARGAAMRLPCWLVLLATLIPPGTVPPGPNRYSATESPRHCHRPAGTARSPAGAGCPGGGGAGGLMPWPCWEPCVMSKGQAGWALGTPRDPPVPPCLLGPPASSGSWGDEMWPRGVPRGERGAVAPGTACPLTPPSLRHSPQLVGGRLPRGAVGCQGLLRGGPLHPELPCRGGGHRRHRGHLVQGLRWAEDAGVPLDGACGPSLRGGPCSAPGGPHRWQLQPAAARGDAGGQRALQVPL